MRRNGKSMQKNQGLLKLRDAALQLGVSYPTIKQWIYKKKIRSVQTPGGHHRIPQSELDRLLFRTRGRTENERKQVVRHVDHYCALSTGNAVKAGTGCRRPYKSHGSDDSACLT